MDLIAEFEQVFESFKDSMVDSTEKSVAQELPADIIAEIERLEQINANINLIEGLGHIHNCDDDLLNELLKEIGVEFPDFDVLNYVDPDVCLNAGDVLDNIDCESPKINLNKSTNSCIEVIDLTTPTQGISSQMLSNVDVGVNSLNNSARQNDSGLSNAARSIEIERERPESMQVRTRQWYRKNILHSESLSISTDETHQFKQLSKRSKRSLKEKQIRTNTDKENINVSQGKTSVRGKFSIKIRDILRDKKNTGSKPHTCKVCHRSFDWKTDLSKHLLVHTGEKPFTCDVCYKSFSHKCSLTMHLLIHTGEKPYTCEICGKSFRQKNTFTEHLLIHTGEKPFACKVCSKSFRHRSTLSAHSKIHTKSN